jgi:DNA-binding transcriptional LysR family regulator
MLILPAKKAELLQGRSAKLQNAPMYDWGDLRFFLAVARAGSTLAAARELKVNQTTVARRIAALEESLGVRLFDRNQDGYCISEAGADFLAQAERVAGEAETFSRLVEQRKRNLSGVVRLTTPDAVANILVTPSLAEFMELYPDIRVEVIGTDARLDLSRGEADIALRAGNLPSDPGLVVRKLAESPWGFYCSEYYARKHGVPANLAEVNDHYMVGVDAWMMALDHFALIARETPRAKIRSVSSTIVNMVIAIKEGHGVGALPCPLGHREPGLVECFRLEEVKYAFYLVTPEALKDLPRIKAFSDFLARKCIERRDLLEGRGKR